MQTTETFGEALDEAFCVLDALCDEIDEQQDGLDEYFDPESDLNFKKRIYSVKELLIELGEVVVEPMAKYLYEVDSHRCIIAADVLDRIGSPAAVPELIDATETDLYDLCEGASKALVTIGTPAVQPLIDRINDRLDNQLDEHGRKISTICAIGTLSRVHDPRSFNFMVELLDRFKGDEYLTDLEFLCGCFYDQHNLEIVPRLEAIAKEHEDATGGTNCISAEAEHVLAHLKIDQALESEYWTIHGCCRICENYDHDENICIISGEYEPRDAFCTGCEPEKAFDCDMCYSADCNIYNLPAVYVDLKYRQDQKESIDEFAITNTRHDSDTGSIGIANESTELILDSSTVELLTELKEFLEGDKDSFSIGVSLSVDYGNCVSGKLVRNGDCIVAVCDEQGPDAELELKLEMAVELEFDSDATDELIAVIDTQRFLLLCDSYRRMDKSREQQGDYDLRIGKLAELLAGMKGTAWAKKPEPEPALECDHEFELLKEHKKYTVYRCVKCGVTRKEFG